MTRIKPLFILTISIIVLFLACSNEDDVEVIEEEIIEETDYDISSILSKFENSKQLCSYAVITSTIRQPGSSVRG